MYPQLPPVARKVFCGGSCAYVRADVWLRTLHMSRRACYLCIAYQYAIHYEYTMNTIPKCVVVRSLVRMGEYSRVLVRDGAYVCALRIKGGEDP